MEQFHPVSFILSDKGGVCLLAVLAGSAMCLAARTGTPFRTIPDLFPVTFPLLAPGKGARAGGAYLCWQILFA